MTQRHTPPSWQVFQKWPGYHGMEIRSGDISIADLRVNGHNAVHGEANAHLITAAPELLQCLAEIVEIFDHAAAKAEGTKAIDVLYAHRPRHINEAIAWRDKTRIAIAKAEGR